MAQTPATSSADPSRTNIDSVMRLEEMALHKRSTAKQLADQVTTAVGSTASIIFHVVWFGGWILTNAGLIPGVAPFDRFPFSFLTLVVSLEAIFLTLLVLMSQNRMMKEADKRTHLDLQINILAEQESTMTLRMVRSICQHMGVEEQTSDEADKLVEATDIDQLSRKLDQQIPG